MTPQTQIIKTKTIKQMVNSKDIIEEENSTKWIWNISPRKTTVKAESYIGWLFEPEWAVDNIKMAKPQGFVLPSHESPERKWLTVFFKHKKT